MSVNCVYCGHVNPDGSTVCLSCGRTLPPAPSGGAGSYGQQPQSWGSQPPNQPPAPSYPPPATNPYPGSSYPPPADSGYGQGQSYGNQAPPSYGNQAPPSYGNQPPSYGNQPQQPQSYGQSYPPPAAPAPTPSYGQGSWSPPAAQPFGGASPDAQTGKQMAMIGMIVGIIGALAGWCCYSGFLFGPVALVLGFIAKSKLSNANTQDGNTMALTAIGLGALATIEPIIYIVVMLVIFGALGAVGGH